MQGTQSGTTLWPLHVTLTAETSFWREQRFMCRMIKDGNNLRISFWST